jgi:carbon monoxide dehydrogenase subunit G
VEFTVAVGVLATTSEGNITLAECDDVAYREVLKVVAKDSGGDTMADATLTIVLTQTADETHAAIQSSVEIGGIAALIKDETFAEVAAETIRTFAANLEALLRQSSPPA